jgi:hypothetical protein
MTSTGNDLTIKFNIEHPDEIPKLLEFGEKFGNWWGRHYNDKEELVSVEVSIKKLFDLITKK